MTWAAYNICLEDICRSTFKNLHDVLQSTLRYPKSDIMYLFSVNN